MSGIDVRGQGGLDNNEEEDHSELIGEIFDRLPSGGSIMHVLDVASRVLKAETTDVEAFCKQFAEEMLRRVLCILDGIPKFGDLSTEDAGEVSRSLTLMSKIAHFSSDFLMNFGENKLLWKNFSSDFLHDPNHLLGVLDGCLDNFSRVKGTALEEKYSNILASFYDPILSLIRQIAAAHLAIFRDEYEFSRFNLKECLIDGVRVLLNEFNFKRVDGDEESFRVGEKLIVLDMDKDLEIYGHFESIALAFYNILKNPLQMWKDAHTIEDKALYIKVRRLQNGCVSISVADNGDGFPFDAMIGEIAEEAREKLEREESLSSAEVCVLDEEFMEAAPECAFSWVFLKRDRSFRKGRQGTGVGLALVEQVLTAHHGDVRIFNHPEHGGGCIELTLPDVDTTDYEERVALLLEALEQNPCPAAEGCGIVDA